MNLLRAFNIIHSLACESALDEECDEELLDIYEEQQEAIEKMYEWFHNSYPDAANEEL